jgi:transcriptional regulator with XRE-family HTH domain
MVESNLSEGVAFQIRATRDQRNMTQVELARAAGMTQNNLSRLESPEYGKHTISSLKRIAEALDVALVVRFVPFSQYIDWLSGTPRIDRGLSPATLAVPAFDNDPGLQEAQGKVIPMSAPLAPIEDQRTASEIWETALGSQFPASNEQKGSIALCG